MKISNTYADPILTDIVVGYQNAGFYAERLFPVVQVDKRTGFYFVWDQANLRSEDDLRTGRAQSKIVDDEAVKTPYGPLKEHALKTFIEQELIDSSDIDNLETARAERLRHRMLLNKEIALATYLSDTGNVTQSDTLSGTAQFSDYTNSDPYGELEEMIEEVRTGSMQKANKIAMGKAVWNKLKYHPDTIELLKAQGGGRFTTELLADWLEVDEVIVLDSQRVTSVEGQTVARADVWGKHVWAMYVNPNPNPSTEEASAGYHLQLTDGVVALPPYRDPDEPDIGEWIKVKDYYEQKVVAPGAISLRKNAVA
jgi:hypothetical protein